jgi:hypothetical protein
VGRLERAAGAFDGSSEVRRERVMRFMLFGGLVIVIYTALAYARRFSAGCGGACPPEGLEYAFVVSLEALLAVLIVSLGTALVRRPPSLRCNGPGLEGRAVVAITQRGSRRDSTGAE